MSNDPLHDFQRAARRLAGHIAPGVSPRWCQIMDDDQHTIATVRIASCVACSDGPAVAGGPAAATASLEPDLRPGWDFTRAVPRFDGDEVKLAGRPLDVLKLLHAADGPLKVDALRKIWDGYDVGESTIRYAIAELRKKLAEQFTSWEGEFVANGPHGYTLEFR